MHMISTHDLEQLEHFDGHGAPVLSVYLNLQPERQLERAFQIAFKSLVRDARRRLDERGREQLEAEAQRVADWLEGEPPRGQGLAVFSCQPAGLWQAHSLPVPVQDPPALEATPYLSTLLDLLVQYQRYSG